MAVTVNVEVDEHTDVDAKADHVMPVDMKKAVVKYTSKERMTMKPLINCSVFAILLLTSCEDAKKTFQEIKGSCEVVIRDDGPKMFDPRYIYTIKNRYRIYDSDNIVIGDSICTYRLTIIQYEDTSKYLCKNVKHKGIIIYE